MPYVRRSYIGIRPGVTVRIISYATPHPRTTYYVLPRRIRRLRTKYNNNIIILYFILLSPARIRFVRMCRKFPISGLVLRYGVTFFFFLLFFSGQMFGGENRWPPEKFQTGDNDIIGRSRINLLTRMGCPRPERNNDF